jgi:hypothetical protein
MAKPGGRRPLLPGGVVLWSPAIFAGGFGVCFYLRCWMGYLASSFKLQVVYLTEAGKVQDKWHLCFFLELCWLSLSVIHFVLFA